MGGSGGALGELWEAQGQLWEGLAELRDAVGELWEGLYIRKLLINRPSVRYATMHQYKIYVEGVCLDSRRPDHRRAWKGGSEPHFLTPLPVDPLDPVDPRDPRMNSKSCKSYVFLQQKWLGPHSGAMFF